MIFRLSYIIIWTVINVYGYAVIPKAFFPTLDLHQREHWISPLGHMKMHESLEIEQQLFHMEKGEHTTKHHLNPVENKTKKSEEDDEFEAILHWFVLHDIDSNGFLDGLELFNAFNEWRRDDPNENNNNVHKITKLIDQILKEDDTNKDGLLSVDEFIFSQHY
jgi:Ca2+-binding EF-hand superfamily protein